jgi:predicted acylesterase/phospholipase RssA
LDGSPRGRVERCLAGGGRLRAAPAFALACALALALTVAGCGGTAPTRTPLPAALADAATVPGIPSARYWGDHTPPAAQDWLQLPDDVLRERYGGVMDRPHDYLVISGGGGDGAFGAGLLVGWTAAGTRPEFVLVTGISTGAIIAPFAFLGPKYDATLREIYTSFSSRDLVRRRGWLEIARGDAVFGTEPLRRQLERYLGDAEIAAIAAEARRGRSLLVGTTNLDAARPVTWDLTKIAASGAPNAKRLIHDVILASAAIPGAFPPVLIQVDAGGRRYDEMHVDGGVTSQLFLGPPDLEWRQLIARLHVTGRPSLYVIRNSKLTPDWRSPPPRIAPIVSRTVASLIRTQGIGDLAQVYIVARREGLDFKLARVPADIVAQPVELFDPAYMRQLFERGYADAAKGYEWIVEREP